MTEVEPTHRPRTSFAASARRHLVLVLTCAVVGLAAGWFGGSGQATTWTSTARVLVNPTVGNPFAPVPASVRQDELTSLETEAQVAGSVEVLSLVAQDNPPLTVQQLQRGVDVVVPPNTQILELSFTASDPAVAQTVTDGLADAYLANRTARGTSVNDERIKKVETQTEAVVNDLRAATVAAQTGTRAQQRFQSELASALRNQLVSLRAQRSYLENSEAPSGSVISAATPAVASGSLVPLVLLALGALLGLAVGVVVAALRERVAGRVRSARDVEVAGLPVVVAPPARRRLRRRGPDTEDAGDTLRRLRAHVVAMSPAPEVVAVAPAAAGGPCSVVAHGLAESLARAGHRVVLVHANDVPEGQRGLGHALLHEGVRPAELLQPGPDPLMQLMSWSVDDDSRERLSSANVRAVLAPLVASGHVVVLQAPGLGSVEGEAVLGAADLGLVVVVKGRTRTRDLGSASGLAHTGSPRVEAVVLDDATIAHLRPTADAAAPTQPDDDEADTDVPGPALRTRR